MKINTKNDFYDNEFVFSTDIECITECPVKAEISIKPEAFGKIAFLLTKYRNVEWAADCIGNKTKNGKYIVKDIYVYEQQVTKTSVLRKECPLKGTIGTIHSHNTMKAFLSHDDMETAKNHFITIVINNNMEMKAVAKVETECGKIMLKEAKIEVSGVNHEKKIKKYDIVANYIMTKRK